MKKRIIAFLLCFALVMPILPAFAVTTEDITLSATSVTLPQYEKKTITAAPGADVQVSAYQWQIKVPGTDLWVDISGAKGATLELSYAMVASLLQGDQAQIRCEAVIGGETVETEVVTVTMDYTSEPAVVTESEPVEPKVLTQATVVESSVSAPASNAKQEETVEDDSDLAALEEARNAAITAEGEAEDAVAAAQEKLTAAQNAEAAAKAALDQAQADYDAAVAAAVPAETEAEDAETTEAAPAVTVDSTARDAAEAAYADAQNATAAAQKELDEANAALTAAQAKTADAQKAYEAAEAKTATTAMAAFSTTRRTSSAVMMADASEVAETEPPEKVNIIINYVFTNGEIAAEPYTAEIAEGSDFYAVVQMPTIQGYLPYVGTEQLDSYTLSYSNIAEDQIINVTYQPTNVNYSIVYMLQNVNGEGYTEDSRETRQGLTDSIVPAVTKEYPGFSMLWYDTPAIAADGSTVVEVYYERNFYLMLFNLDGGYGVEPIYARYDSAVSVGTPSKAGYTFNGWTPAVPATMPVDGGTYTAQWTANDTAKVSVVFWGENPNDEGYSYLTTGVINAKPGTEYTFVNGSSVFLICGKDEHTHTVECSLICGKTEHTQHTEDCISCTHECDLNCYGAGNYTLVNTTKPSQIDTPTRNGVYTYNTGIFGGTTHYYLYLDGTWYCAGYEYRGNTYTEDTQSITHSCTHTHTSDCYTCEYHAHTAACYSCGKEAHTHTSSCNQTGSGLNSKLWTFVRSETVTVAADGSSVVNVYYDRTTFTLTFHYNYSRNNYNSTSTITDKWGADIGTRFLAVNTTAKGNLWSTSTDGEDPWTSYLQIMPQNDEDYYCRNSSTTEQTAEYYTENADGTYSLEYSVTAYYGEGNLTISAEDFYEMEGFTYSHGTDGEGDSMSAPGRYGDFNGAKFYYKRHHYSIEFYSPTVLLKKTENVPYESALSGYNWTPDASQAPAQYEPGSVVFEGWYLSPECTGDKFDFTTHTMPAGTKDGDTTLTLYAKWVPVTHTVKIYPSDTDAKNGKNQIGDTLEVPHGSKVKTKDIPENPTSGNLKFVGWFYMDGDVEKAFDFNNMPVNKDLVIYAKWSDSTVVPYFIYYRAKDSNGNVVMDENGNPLELADATTGHALTGLSRTFEALPGEKLIENYQEGWFPETKSHNMVLTAGKDNSFIFYYVPVNAVPYTVKYLEEGTGAVLHDEKYVEDNRKAVVTENFVVIPGYMPDAYQKRLVVSADGIENEIIFYYHKDDSHAYYMLSHHTQNLDGATYTEVSSSQAIGDVGTEYFAQPQNIPGFTYVESKTEIVVGGSTTPGTSHVLTTGGLEIKHYYDRNAYPYIVRYLEAETNKELAPEKTKDAEGNTLTGLYGEVVSENKIDITGYTCISKDAQTLTIRIEEDAELEYNIITFYYQENEAKIIYEVVGPTGSGTVDLNEVNDTAAATVFEEFKAASGAMVTPEIENKNAPVGATAKATSNVYKFEGWYLDAACTQPVNADWVNANGSIVPVKPQAGWPDVTTYYAKFVWNKTHMTLKKVVNGDVYDTGDSFIFKVSDAKGTVLTTVSLQAGGSVVIDGLTVGESYTITEIGGGSNRYTADASVKPITLEANPDNDASKNVVTFTNTLSNNKWLTASDVKHNVFG